MKKEKIKKPLNPKIREGIYFLERLLMVVLSACITLVFMNSFFKIVTSYGTTYHYAVLPFEKEQSFEEREIFHTLLLGKMEQITEYAAISHVLETKGEYDGTKVIDLGEKIQEESSKKLTVPYYLDDLIAWGNYGFEYITYTGTWQDLETIVKGESQGEENEENSTLKKYEGSLEDNRNKLAQETPQEGRYAMEVIKPRYYSIQGKDLLEYASSIEEYEMLKEVLIALSGELCSDYTKYIALKEECAEGKTNVNYCLKIPNGQEEIYYTNSTLDTERKTPQEITSEIRSMSKTFLYFDPDKVQINTNTDISAKQMRNLLREQKEIFTDSAKVWFWMDDHYNAEDSFQKVKTQLEEYKPYQHILLITIIISVLAIILCVIILTKTEGRAWEEDRLIYITKKSDRFPVETWTILVIMAEGCLFVFIGLLLHSYQKGNLSAAVVPVLVGITAFLGNEIGSRWYLSMVRRKKAGCFFKTTLFYLMGKKGKEFAVKTYENGGLVSRTWIPYLVFLMINLILVLLGIGGVVGAFLLDMLLGIFYYNQKKQLSDIVEGIQRIREGDSKHRIDTSKLKGELYDLAVAVNGIGSGIRLAVESSMKDEKMKTDLITNVSHDIKTPLTSIITYVDLLKRENIKEERILGYLDILDNKSQRLKQLIDDLVEASKISSGNISLQFDTLDFVQLVKQALGEFDERLKEKQLQLVFKDPKEAMFIEADSSQLWRVMENLITNACKYSLSGTRIYVEMDSVEEEGKWRNHFFIKNISENLLEVGAEELMERFMRGDLSRKTEGSGLGLSIAKNLIEAMGGEFKIEVDGDLFKASISFEAVLME